MTSSSPSPAPAASGFLASPGGVGKSRSELGPAVSCPSCKVPSREMYCSSCVTEAIRSEASVHDAQKTARDGSKKVLSGFLRDNMDSATLAFETNNLESDNEKLRQLVEQARVQLGMLRDVKKEWQETLERRKKELGAAKERMVKATTYDDETVEPIVASLEQAAGDLEESVATERRKKMEQLFEIFPLVVAEPGFAPVSTIAGVPLPSDFQSHPENPQYSLALVLISRVVLMSAHYLRIPLPYHLIYDRGEAWIEHHGQLVPVQRRVKNLYINIRALCLAQGVPANVVSKVDFIECLWQLFHSPSLGRPVREAMLDAEMRENKLVMRRAETSATPTMEVLSINQGSTGTTGQGILKTPSKTRKSKEHDEDDDFVLVS